MNFPIFIDYITYAVIFLTLIFQLTFGIRGLIYKEDHLKGFQFFLFLFFLSTEISRSFFPIYVSSFDINLEENVKITIPQLLWGVGFFLSTTYAWKISKKVCILKILKYCCLVTFISIFAMSMTNSYFIMIIFRVINSICFGIVSLLAVLYLININTQATTMKYFLYSIALASIAGNALTGFLSSHFAYSNILMGSSFPALIAYFVLDFCFEKKYSIIKPSVAKTTSKKLLHNVNVQIIALITTLPYRFILVGFFYFFVPIYMHSLNYSMDKIGQTFMIFFIINTIFLEPISRLIDKNKFSKHLLLISYAIISISFFGFYHFAANYLLLLLFTCFLAFGMTINNCLQIPIIPIILKQECRNFGKTEVIGYMITVDKIGSLIGSLVIPIFYKILGGEVILALSYMALSLLLLHICFFFKQNYFEYKEASKIEKSEKLSEDDELMLNS